MLVYCYEVWEEFKNFIDGRNGFAHWMIFGLAILCCIFMGKNIRKKMFWPSLFVLLFFFNPLFYGFVGTRFLSGVYWRLLWMLPISFVIAYVFTQLACKIRKDIVRAAAIVAAAACIIVTGEGMFTEATYAEKENDYELPQAAIDITDAMVGNLEDWKEIAIVPNELLCYIRQYTCAIGLLYGRNAEGFISSIGEQEALVFEEMGKENPDVELITDIGKEKNCKYIVFNTSFHQIPDDLTEYGYELFREMKEDYVIYRRIKE